MLSPPTNDPLLDTVRAALSEVLDPEIGESLIDLGLVAEVAWRGSVLEVTLIPTSATCPMADVLLEEATDAVQRVCPAEVEIRVVIDWTQDWSPQRMAPALRERFGW